jgi:hypothetical protein
MRIGVLVMAIVFLYLMISYRKYSLGAIAAVAHVMLFFVFILYVTNLCLSNGD